MPNRKQTQFWKRRMKRMQKRLHLLFMPHKHNHYRPHLIRRYGIIAILTAVIGVQVGYNFTQTGTILGDTTDITANGLLAATNTERAEHSQPPLVLNEQLSRAAQAKARDMLAQDYWSHNAPDGTEPWKWIDDEAYGYSEAGENLAKNFHTATTVTTAWMDSPSHRANVLNGAYRDVGFAIAHGDLGGETDTTLVVAMYGAPTDGVVQGVQHNAQPAVTVGSLSVMDRIGLAIQSLTPAAIVAIALLFVATTIAITAHAYRSKLPKHLQTSWYKQHGAVKASGFLVIASMIVLTYGGWVI